MMFVLAHAGHWLVSLLYVVPVIAVIIALVFQSRRERARAGDEDLPD